MSPAAVTPSEALGDGGEVSHRRLPVGAEVRPGGGVHFRVWAPKCRKVEVVGEAKEGSITGAKGFALQPEGKGYFSGFGRGFGDGSLYRYRLDGEKLCPDPASRFQPEGPHGPSMVVDPEQYPWGVRDWKGLRLEGQVFYELHLGTFTPEGTWDAASKVLPRLAELGITAVEIMPVAEFAGSFGWGYDGVDLYAPYHRYGTPDDMRRFVDEAHGLGLGVILDVVYNHFGPEGCYLHDYSDDYVHKEKPGSDWGDAINFDGPESGPVREYFIANASYWISEYRLDGLRLDATQAILDDSKDHVLAAMSRQARAAAGGRAILLIAENEPQNSRLVRSPNEGGYGLDALWNDDFHHSVRVALTGHAEAYYCDFQGSPQELVSAVRWGYLFQGQICKWQQKKRGSSALGIPAARFVTYLENHDQVANSSLGLRVRDQTSPGRYRAMSTLWLLAPQTPMLFQGQELGTSRPFVYFSDHRDPLADCVREGRREELSGFRSTTHPELRAYLPDPSSSTSFLGSKIEAPANYADLPMFAFFQDLLRLRREDAVFRAQRSDAIHGAVLGPEALVLRYFGEGEGADCCRLVLVNLGRDLYPTPNTEPLLAPPPGMDWSALWFSEHPRFGGGSIPPLEPGQPWRMPGHTAIVLAPIPASPAPEQPEMGSSIGEDYDVHPAIRKRRRDG
jgi:maltooligosyltrehalose trehalohydrolase